MKDQEIRGYWEKFTEKYSLYFNVQNKNSTLSLTNNNTSTSEIILNG